MKLYVLFIFILMLAKCHLQLIDVRDSETPQKSCLDRCQLSWENDVEHEELDLRKLKQPQNTEMPALQQQEQLAQCRQNVQQFDCTLKCMF